MNDWYFKISAYILYLWIRCTLPMNKMTKGFHLYYKNKIYINNFCNQNHSVFLYDTHFPHAFPRRFHNIGYSLNMKYQLLSGTLSVPQPWHSLGVYSASWKCQLHTFFLLATRRLVSLFCQLWRRIASG